MCRKRRSAVVYSNPKGGVCMGKQAITAGAAQVRAYRLAAHHLARPLPAEKRAIWAQPSPYGRPDRQTLGGAAVSFLLRPCAFGGEIVFGRRAGQSPTFATYRHWLGRDFAPRPDAARRPANLASRGRSVRSLPPKNAAGVEGGRILTLPDTETPPPQGDAALWGRGVAFFTHTASPNFAARAFRRGRRGGRAGRGRLGRRRGSARSRPPSRRRP